MSKTSSPPTVAIGIERTPVGWVVAEYQMQDGKVVSVKRTEPNLRAIALESLRRSMAQFWEG